MSGLSRCPRCGVEFEQPWKGGPKRWCSGKCRRAAYMERVATSPASVEAGCDPVEWSRGDDDALALVHADLELLGHGAEVLACEAEHVERDSQMIAVAEVSGRSVWRYVDDAELDEREAARAFREFSSDYWVFVE